MMFEIPALGEVPSHFATSTLPRPLARVARDMARHGLVDEADTRVGTGGARRLVEKSLERWWRDRNLSERAWILPLRFFVVAGSDMEDVPPRGRDDCWLLLECGRWTRCYLQRLQGVAEACPEFYEHLLATTYFALDSVCYSLKPPDMLRLAKAYWWRGLDDDKEMRARGHRPVMSRRRFDNRIPRITQAPRYDRSVLARTRGFSRIKEALERTDRWMRDPRILRPNAHRITGHPPGSLAVALRYRYGDPTFQLLHDHWHHMGRRKTAGFMSAWRIPSSRQGLQTLLERIEATVHLCGAIEDLLDETTWWSKGSFN